MAFFQNRRHALISIIAGTVFACFFLLLALVASGVERWFCLGVAAISAWADWRGISALRNKTPLLLVDAVGLTYRNFSPQRVPWSEIDEIAIVRRHQQWVRLTKSGYAHRPQLDSINFSVRDPSRYPRGLGRMTSRKMNALAKLPPIVIQTWFLDAPTEQVAGAIKAHWKGEMREVDIKTR